MNQIAEIFAALGFELDEDSLKKVDGFFKRAADKLDGFAQTAGATLLRGFAAFFAGDLYNAVKGAAASVIDLFNPVSLAAGAKAFADIADATGKAAVSLGVSNKELQQLKWIASQNGVEFEQISRSIDTAKRGIAEAAQGSKSWRDSFKRLGLDYRELASQDSMTRFSSIVEGLRGVSDATERAALAQKFFGRDASRFNALIDGGAESIEALKKKADDLGFIVDDDTINASLSLNESLDALNGRLDGVKNRLYAAVIPALKALVDAASAFVDATGPLLKDLSALAGAGAAALFSGLASALRFLASVLGVASKRLSAAIKALGGFNTILKLAVISAVAFGAAWLWVNSGAVALFLNGLMVQLARVAFLLAANTVAAFRFLTTLSLSSIWSAITASFARLAAVMTGTTAQFVLITLFVFALLLALEDLYGFFNGDDSEIGDLLGIDAANLDLQEFSFLLMSAGLALAALLFLFNPFLALLLAFALMVAYIAVNWDLVLAVFEYVYDEIVDGLSNLMLKAYNGFLRVGGTIKDFFMGIVATVKESISDLIDTVVDLPQRARGLLSSVTGLDLGSSGAGAQLAVALAGDGARSPAVDAQLSAARSAANRSVTVAPTITLAVDATDRSAADATALVRDAIGDELWRELERAYDGDED